MADRVDTHQRVAKFPKNLNFQCSIELRTAVEAEMNARRARGVPCDLSDIAREWCEAGAVEAGAMTFNE